MLKEMKQGWDNEIADLKGVIDGIERDCEHAKQVAKAMAERDPEMRLLGGWPSSRVAFSPRKFRYCPARLSQQRTRP